MRLVELLKLCLAFEISETMLNQIDEGFRLWVVDYEKFVLFFPLVYHTEIDIGCTTNVIPIGFLPVL